MRVLILGATGFAGRHLADLLARKKNIELFGTARAISSASELSEAARRKLKLRACDLLGGPGLEKVLKESRPDRLFHLAGQASVLVSWQRPKETFIQNVIGTSNKFEALKKLELRPRIHIAGSSEEYGWCPPKVMPINEDTPLRPVTPYAVSKVAQDLLGYQQFKANGFDVVRTRAFNHIGPGQSVNFVSSGLARQVALIEAGEQEDQVLRVGNTEVMRDFTDVRDMVAGYWLALEKGKAGEVYNLCSGRGHKVNDIISILVSASRIPIRVEKDPARIRKTDVPRFIGDARRFKRLTGWKPVVPFRRSVIDTLDYWRQRIRRSGSRQDGNTNGS